MKNTISSRAISLLRHRLLIRSAQNGHQVECLPIAVNHLTFINISTHPGGYEGRKRYTMTKNAEKKARAMLSRLSTERLIKEFDMTEDISGIETSMVRGWIMDELEKRNPTAYDEWLDMDYPTNEALRELYLGDQALQIAETK